MLCRTGTKVQVVLIVEFLICSISLSFFTSDMTHPLFKITGGGGKTIFRNSCFILGKRAKQKPFKNEIEIYVWVAFVWVKKGCYPVMAHWRHKIDFHLQKRVHALEL